VFLGVLCAFVVDLDMSDFLYQRGRLYCEGVAVERIAASAGTPVYVYSRAVMERNFRRYDRAFRGCPHTICYSVKANSNLALLRLLAGLGGGFDIVSGGELHRVLAAGGDPGRLVFSGVGKTAAEIEAALRAGILLFNAESAGELSLLARLARKTGRKAPAALRVNPDVGAGAHPYISTGLRRHKFGIDIHRAEALYLKAARARWLQIAGVSCHIGSQILALEPFLEALEKLLDLAERLRRHGLAVRYLDVGGGLGVSYRSGEAGPDIAEYGRRIRRILDSAAGERYHLLLEPGRSIIGEAGILLARVLYTKRGATKRFIIVDAAMNDLLRPALYGSYHEVRPAANHRRRQIEADIVGPICESGDFLAQDRRLPEVRPGELLAVFTTGAYGAALGSNYNSRPRAPEVLVEGERFRIIRERESYEDLVRLERP
jgi:diaminopimelate decarboxylase